MFIVNGSRYTAREMLVRALAEDEGAGDCLKPIEIVYRGLPDPVRVKLRLEPDSSAIARYYARCRKCDPCLMHRRRLWTARAVAECAVASRTWFGTLTFAPVERVKHLYRAQLRRSRQTSDPWAKADEAEQFRCIVGEAGSEVTRYLKRLRKDVGRFRYLLVSEAHKDGFPHFHLLLHELDNVVKKRQLDEHWHQGFAKWRLVALGDPLGARYVCKYLNKSALTRVRASQRYGQLAYVGKLFAERLEGVNVSLNEALATDETTRACPRDDRSPQRSEDDRNMKTQKPF